MFPSYPSLTCPHLLSSHLIFHILPLFYFSYFLLSSPRLIIRTCGKHRRTCLGIWINHGACVLEAFCAPCFYLCLSVCLLFFFSLMNIHPVSPLSSLSLSFSNLHIFFFFLFVCLPISLPHLPFTIFPFWLQMSSLPPKRLTTHPQFSLIELRSLRTSALRFNLFWPEQGACTPSLHCYIRGMGWRHHGQEDRLNPECNHHNAPQQRASTRIRGYGNGVEGWLRFQ